MNASQAARELGISRSRVHQLIVQGKLRASRCACGHGLMINSLQRTSKSPGRPRRQQAACANEPSLRGSPVRQHDAGAAVHDAVSAAECNKRALLMATSADPSVRDGPKALELAKRALELEPGNADFMNTMGAAYAEAGDFDEAERWQLRAMEHSRFRFSEGARRRLELYRQAKPVREESR